MTVLIVVQGLVILLLAVLVVGLLRSHAEILRALHDLGVNLEDGAPQGGTKTFDLRTRARGAERVEPWRRPRGHTGGAAGQRPRGRAPRPTARSAARST